MTTFAAMFAGGGLKSIGAIQADYSPVLAIEFDPALASCYAENLGDKHLRVEDVRHTPDSVYRAINGVELLMASPPCTRASIANANAGESDMDGELAEAVCRAIRLSQPRCVMVENVQGYRSFAAYRRITDCLDALGYWWVDEVVNSADFSVPQTRRRLILRASRDGFLPPLNRTHSEKGGNGLLPWNGWYGAVEDLLPDCPETDLAPWQKARLPDELKTMLVQSGNASRDMTILDEQEPCSTVPAAVEKAPYRAVLVDTFNSFRESSAMEESEPSFTIKSGHMRRPITTPCAILVEGTPVGDRPPTRSVGGEPSMTVNAGGGGRVHRAILCPPNGECYQPKEAMEPSGSIAANHGSGKYRAIIPGIRIVSLTPRCLARFQTLPDWYQLPAKKSLACQIIGNGVPCTLSRVVCESFK